VKCGARVALGVAGGYFLGRTKKMKLALMLGGMAAGRQAGGPAELLAQGTKLLGKSPELTRLADEVRGRLLDAGKGAAMAVAARQVEGLTERVSKRVESIGDAGKKGRDLGGKVVDAGQDDDYEDEDEAPAAADDEADEPAEDAAPADEDEAPEEQAPARKPARAARSSSGRASGGTRGATATLERSGGTAAAKRAGRTASGAASKTAAKTPEKATGTARKAAAGSTRKATGSTRGRRSSNDG
jgi:hypothetical protein